MYEAFTKALSCLCRYGDETVIRATPEELSLAVVGVNQTSYCRFTFLRNFFERGYHVGPKPKPSNSRPSGAGWRRTEPRQEEEENDNDGIEEVNTFVAQIAGKVSILPFRFFFLFFLVYLPDKIKRLDPFIRTSRDGNRERGYKMSNRVSRRCRNIITNFRRRFCRDSTDNEIAL